MHESAHAVQCAHRHAHTFVKFKKRFEHRIRRLTFPRDDISSTSEYTPYLYVWVRTYVQTHTYMQSYSLTRDFACLYDRSGFVRARENVKLRATSWKNEDEKILYSIPKT